MFFYIVNKIYSKYNKICNNQFDILEYNKLNIGKENVVREKIDLFNCIPLFNCCCDYNYLSQSA